MMTLEEKFYECLDKYFINDDDQFNSACDDLAKIAVENFDKQFFEFVRRTDELEKENAELKVSIDKIKNATFECDTCLDVCYENERLEKENALLKAKLTANRFIFRTTVRNEYLDKIEKLENEVDFQKTVRASQGEMIGKLNKQLSEIKYLDRQEVEKIIRGIDPSRLGSACWKGEVDKALTAICNLVIPKIDRDKIVEVLKKFTELIHYMPDNKGVWNETQGDKYLGRQSEVIHSWQFTEVADEIISAIGGK